MSDRGLNINEAAKKLGVSTRTIRRHIKSGKIKADFIKGSFGEEYRILELPPQFNPNMSLKTEDEPNPDNDKTTNQQSEGIAFSAMDLIRELQDKNMALAAQLGAAAERIRTLEGQLKLLPSPKVLEPQRADPMGGAIRTLWERLFPHLLVGPDEGHAANAPSENR